MCETLVRTLTQSVCRLCLSWGSASLAPAATAVGTGPAKVARPRARDSHRRGRCCGPSRGRRPRQRTLRQEQPREGPPPRLQPASAGVDAASAAIADFSRQPEATTCYVNLQEKKKTLPVSGPSHRFLHFPLCTFRGVLPRHADAFATLASFSAARPVIRGRGRSHASHCLFVCDQETFCASHFRPCWQ